MINQTKVKRFILLFYKLLRKIALFPNLAQIFEELMSPNFQSTVVVGQVVRPQI